MLKCFVTTSEKVTPVYVVKSKDYKDWLAKQDAFMQTWLTASQFRADPNTTIVVPNQDGGVASVVCGSGDEDSFWTVGNLPFTLPEGDYAIETSEQSDCALAWGLGAYKFDRYKKPSRAPARLLVTDAVLADVEYQVNAIYLTRNLINTPAEDMGPTQLAAAAETLAEQFDAEFTQIVGDELLKQDFFAIHAVGRASDDSPRLLDLHWGDTKHPKVTLVGKGVCFDTGGLDIKNSSGMLLMKKDMGGSANVLGLAHMVMAANLPVRLRVLIPAVENAVSGNAYRPGDVIKSKKGISIEIGNTDAEGRLVLADAITEAVAENPDLLLDMATLTGAARIALGAELPAMYATDNSVAAAIEKHADNVADPVWHMPLFKAYREFLNSPIADINNASPMPYGGSITAALFLQEFVPSDINWLHFDLMGWNLRALPGRPVGGEAMAVRALFSYLRERYA